MELYEKLVSAGSDDYFESTDSINIVSGTASYALPSDYLKTIAVDIKVDGGDYVNMPRYTMGERNMFSRYNLGTGDSELQHYRIRGSNMVIIPTPQYAETAGIVHRYVAVPATLTDVTPGTTDVLDGIAGWEDFIVYKCLIKFIGGKEEGDPSVWMQLLQQMEDRISRMKTRDRNEPGRVRNMEDEWSQRFYPRYGKTI